MKGRLFFGRVFVSVVFSLLLAVAFDATPSHAGELIPETDILTLAVPSTAQTFYDAACDFHDVAVAADGSFVVTWVFNADITPSRESYILPVYARRFNADGTPQTGMIQVCEGFSPEDNMWNTSPRIACDDDGNFVVCWTKINRDGSGPWFYIHKIYGRLFDAEGLPLSEEFEISDGTQTTDTESAAVAMNGQGDFVVAWNKYRDFYQPLVYFKRFDHSGSSLDLEPKKVNTLIESISQFAYGSSRPSVAINADGGFAVSWATIHFLFTFPMAMLENVVVYDMVRQYNKDGLPMGCPNRVETIHYSKALWPDWMEYSTASPVVAMNNNGEYAVSYFRLEYESGSREANYDYNDAGYRFYGKAGFPRTAGKKMAIYMKADSLVNGMDDDGNLVMGWIGCDEAEKCFDSEAIYLMTVSKNPFRSKDIVQVAENVPYDPTENTPSISFPALDVSANGRLVVVWHDNEKLLGRIYTVQ